MMEKVRLPRAAGAFLAVLLMLGIMYAGSYFLYGKAMSFVHEFLNTLTVSAAILHTSANKPVNWKKPHNRFFPKTRMPRNHCR